jgi:hypothetical protein
LITWPIWLLKPFRAATADTRLPEAPIPLDELLEVLRVVPLQPRPDPDEGNLPGVREAPEHPGADPEDSPANGTSATDSQLMSGS